MKKQVNLFFGKILKKDWPPELVKKYVGDYQQCYFTYASDPVYREKSASGGSITALLSFLLSSGEIDGALVCRAVVNSEGKLRPEFFIAQTIDELKSAQGSKYSAVFFSSQALPLIRDFNGRLAVVALPCDTTILRRALQNQPELQKRVKLIITLFCNHNSEPVLTDEIIDRIRPNDKPLVEYQYKMGHWRGMLQARFEDNVIVTKPYTFFSDYQNLFFFSQRKCQHCIDHTGYHSDISAGDIWSLRMKNHPIKHTALIARNEKADQIVRKALASGILNGQAEPITEVCEGQARNMPTHYNITARSRLSWISQEKIKDSINERVRLNQYLVAAIILTNERISRNPKMQKFIFAIPRPILKLYLYLMKFLESL